MSKPYATSTLMGLSKAQLIDHIRILEHNNKVLQRQLDQQYKNVKDWQPVKHGHWVGDPDAYHSDLHCSECGELACGIAWWECHLDPTPWCPHCGAKMDEVIE